MRIALDVECYVNYFLAVFTKEDGSSKSFEIFNDDVSKFDVPTIRKLITADSLEFITFNGNGYDMLMLDLALAGFNTRYLKKVSDMLIVQNKRPWMIYKDTGIGPTECNHIDLIEVVIGMVSLKVYGGRMHSKRLQDLPLPPDAVITEDQLPLMRKYCKNDTLVTHDLYNNLQKQIELRRQMSEKYNIDLRSKSDAQIAEAVLISEFKRITGIEPPKTKIDYKTFKYEPPAYVKFRSEVLREALETICSADMNIKESGHVEMPKAISKMKIKIGDTTYKIGIGGLHSQESEIAHYTTDEHQIIDRDVASYYPNLMLNMGMSPGSFGDYFQDVYRELLDKRMASKRRVAEIEKEINKLERELEALDEQDVSP